MKSYLLYSFHIFILILVVSFQNCTEVRFEKIMSSQSLEFEKIVIAKEKLQISLPSNASSTQGFPYSTVVNSDSHQLFWQSDLQDIGKHFNSSFMVSEEFGTKHSLFNFTVAPPPIEITECATIAKPVIGTIKPVEKWHWKGYSSNQGFYKLTYSSPVVGDLDNNDSVEIVSIASLASPYYNVDGPLVVLNGKDGTVLWNTLEESGFGAEVSTTPALVDLDHDNSAEIIFITYGNFTDNKRAIAIADFKTRKLKTTYHEGFNCGTFCMPAVADLDGDGNSEIVAGNIILDHAGRLKARLNPEPIMTIAKTPTLAELVSSSPGLEVIQGGSQVYSSTGNLLWKGDCLGFSAVSDIDADGSPDLVCIGNSYVNVYRSDGSLLWVSKIPSLPDNTDRNSGGAPNIADFTGDGFFEIGTAGGDFYVVFDKMVMFSETSNYRQIFSPDWFYHLISTAMVLRSDFMKPSQVNFLTALLNVLEGGTFWDSFLNILLSPFTTKTSVEIIVSAPGLRSSVPLRPWHPVTSRNLFNR
ncbi:MAG: VCBS repeat-containing protein [Bdellovibrionaceae bacterium]|nr:VCBS repeat-containing protein [Pseudobdellovibrionaceae bacterium]